MPEKKVYSHSKLKTFEQCPIKYKFKYIDKIKTVDKSIETLLGFAVHAVLEYLHSEVKIGRIPSVEEIIMVYSSTWTDNYNENIVIVKDNLNDKYYFNKGIEFLTTYYTQNHPFDDNTLEVEKRIRIKLGENNEYEIIGFIDRLVYNLKENRYEVHDYKTSSSMPRKEQIESDRQLSIYAIAIKEIFGSEKEVVVVWHYLAHNQKIHLKKENHELEKHKKEIIELIKKIESTNNFPPRVSALCHWCEYKSICPAWENKRPKFEKQQKLNLESSKEIKGVKEEELDIWD